MICVGWNVGRTHLKILSLRRFVIILTNIPPFFLLYMQCLFTTIFQETFTIYSKTFGNDHEKTKESGECLKHLTQQAVTFQKRINEVNRQGANNIGQLLPIEVCYKLNMFQYEVSHYMLELSSLILKSATLHFFN